MKSSRGLALGVGLSFFLSCATSLFAAALTTTPTRFFADAPLLVTAYQRDTSGLKFVQLFNAGDTPLELSEWKLTNESGVQLSLSGVAGKWLAPDTHIIASLPGVVNGATSTSGALGFGTSAKLVIAPPANSVYKQTEYELKTAGPTVWRRSTTLTGYSSSTTSFTAFTEQALFDDGLYTSPAQPTIAIVEVYPYASDCSPHDTSVLCGDYVKLHNVGEREVALDDFVLRSDSSSSNRTSSNTITLDGINIPAGGYQTVWHDNDGGRLSLTNSGGYVWLEDAWGLEVYEPTTVRYESAGSAEQGLSWAQKDDGTWAWSSSPQPLGANAFPFILADHTNVLSECPAGKYRNPETNRCRTIEEAVNALAICPEGQTRNLDTNRCRATATTASAGLTPCKEGQERNPATNRCRSVASAIAELIPCDEGYERNPATNRCRKVQPLTTPASIAASQTMAGADNAALPWVLGFAAAGAVGYGMYEWRRELAGIAGKLIGTIRK